MWRMNIPRISILVFEWWVMITTYPNVIHTLCVVWKGAYIKSFINGVINKQFQNNSNRCWSGIMVFWQKDVKLQSYQIYRRYISKYMYFITWISLLFFTFCDDNERSPDFSNNLKKSSLHYNWNRVELQKCLKVVLQMINFVVATAKYGY